MDIKIDLLKANMLFDKEFTINSIPIKTEESKIWISFGDGKEILEKKGLETIIETTKGSEQIILNKKYKEKLEVDDLIYYSDRWLPIIRINEGLVFVKIDDKEINIPINDCIREIPMQILLCSIDSIFLHIMSVKGNYTLEYLSKKLYKKFNIKTSKGSWYYLGKLCNNSDTIESIHMKPNEKLSCIALKHDIKTFKRFKQLDESRGWYMSHTSPDAIGFVPSITINLFGFGMYYTREGPTTYIMKYEILLGDDVKKSDTVTVTKTDDSAQIGKIWLTSDHDPIVVPGGVKISIVVRYIEYEDNSRLMVGTAGEDYDGLEGNDPGLFKVEESSISANGTDIHAGQIPEIYYTIEGRA